MLNVYLKDKPIIAKIETVNVNVCCNVIDHNNKDTIMTDQEKPKYYTEKSKEYMRAYRAKHGSYTEMQKKAIKKYTDRIKHEAKLYREFHKKGLITD